MKGPRLDRAGPSWILSHVWSSLQAKIIFLAASSIVNTNNQSWVLQSKARITLSLSLLENHMALLLPLKAQPWKGAESKENAQDGMGSSEPQLYSVQLLVRLYSNGFPSLSLNLYTWKVGKQHPSEWRLRQWTINSFLCAWHTKGI